MSVRRLVRVACLAGMAALAGLEFHRIFGWDPVAARVLCAALLAAAVPTALLWGGTRHIALTVSASVLLLAVYLTVVVQATAPVDGPGGVLDGVVNGWSRLLTTTVPAPPRADLLMLPVLVTWLAALIAVELALRSRFTIGAITPSAVAYVVAMLFTVGTSESRVVPAVIWVALAVAAVRLAPTHAPVTGVSVSDERMVAGTHHGSGLAVPTICFLVGIVVFAGVVGPRLPGADAADPVDPREHRTPPLEDLTAVNPMSLLSGWAREPDDELFEVESKTPAAWRLAVLDQYDGTQWSANTAFAVSGARLPGDLSRGVGDVERLTQGYTIKNLRGVWLPAATRPVEIAGLGAFVDTESGVLARPEGLTQGLRYEIVSEWLRDAACDTAAVSDPGTLAIPSSDTNAEFQQNLASLSSRITSGVTSPCERARAIEQYLRSNYEFDPEAPGGSHLRAMSDFLTAEKRGRGTSEQFASAFAILGRYAGLPTRVVIGFHGGEEQGDGTWLVRSGDAFAWGEVRFDGVGWVAFDPTPPVEGAAKPPEKIAEEEARAQDPPDAETSEGPTRVVERESEAQKNTGGGTSLFVRILVGGVVVLAVIGVVLILLAVLARLGRNRRRRRRQAVVGTRSRIVGAWWEALDALEDRGLDVDRGRTAAQWVYAGRSLVDDERHSDLDALGVAVNAALFSPEVPTDEDVRVAWAHADAVLEATQRGMTRGERVRWLLDPRPWFASTPAALGEDLSSPAKPASARA